MEVTGLVVALLPLLAKMIVGSDKCLAAMKRFRNAENEAESLFFAFDLQVSIFRNNHRQLLSSLLARDEKDNIDKMFGGIGDLTWDEQAIGDQLVKRLGNSYKLFARVVEVINRQLQTLEKDIRSLESTLLDEDEVKRTKFTDKPWTRYMGQRANLSLFRLPRLGNAIDKLRESNSDFRNLVAPLYEDIKRRSKRHKKAIPQHTKELEEYKLVGRASRMFYEAMSEACTDHPQHLAHFCVETDRLVFDENHSSEVVFRMALNFVHRSGPQATGFTINSTLKDAKTLKRQNELAVTQTRDHIVKRTAGSVKYDSPIEASPSTDSTAAQIHGLTLRPPIAQPICKFLIPCFLIPPAESMLPVMSEETVSCTHVIRPSLSAYSCTAQPTSLRQLIQPLRGRPRLERFPPVERIRLAKTLAKAVLEYGFGPWLRRPWRCEDILFLDLQDGTNGIDKLTSPHVNVYIDGTRQHGMATAMPATPHEIARNSRLFGLGVTLIEIAFKCPYDELRRESDVGDSPDQRLNDLKLIERLANAGCTGMGIRYDNIIRKLVGCDFGFGTDLNKPQLQNAFYDAVISPLMALEKEMLENFY